MTKRAFDLCCASILFVLCMPLFAVIALLIKCDSGGPVLFRQQRAGRHEVPFTIFKFRTLQDGVTKPHDMVRAGDPRITRTGRLLRSTHLDELPQLWNVIRGDMSLVGPRPTSLDLVEINIHECKGYRRRFAVRPGLTGLTQIRGREKNLRKGSRGEVLLDDYYIRHHSVCFDCKILLLTVVHVIRRHGV